MKGVKERPSLRFWRMVDVKGPDECWPWQGYSKVRSRDGKGSPYGTFNAGATTKYAHRFAFEDVKGAIIAPGWMVCHTCDNSLCCNPDHLLLGTHDDNMRQATERGRRPSGDRHWKRKAALCG